MAPTPEQLEIILKTIIGEMDGEDESVQKAFAWLVWNRFNEPHWIGSGDLVAVARQFSCWTNEEGLKRLANDSTSSKRQNIEAWLRTLFEGSDPTEGATFMYSPEKTFRSRTAVPLGAKGKTPTVVIGEWQFSKWFW